MNIGAEAQTGNLSGKVTSENMALTFATVSIQKFHLGSSTDSIGKYIIGNIRGGTYKVVTTSVGYRKLV